MAEKFWKKSKAEEEGGLTGMNAESNVGDTGAIQVRICGREKGLELYEDVSFVRVRSKKYNLLIMKDYLPILGKVEGSIAFRTGREELEREGVSGFFMHKNNTFSLMLEDVRPQTQAEAAPGEGAAADEPAVGRPGGAAADEPAAGRRDGSAADEQVSGRRSGGSAKE